MQNTALAPAHAALGVEANRAPLFTKASAFSGVRL
jgi:hypothetical protein